MFRAPLFLPAASQPSMQAAAWDAAEGWRWWYRLGSGVYKARVCASSCSEHEHSVTFPNSGGLVGEALGRSSALPTDSASSFPHTEKCPHVPAHGAVLPAAGNHLERKGSALPPAGHALGPVSIVLRRRQVALSLCCSCSPPLTSGAGAGMHRAAESRGKPVWARKLPQKAFVGFQVAGWCQHHQRQQRWLRGMAGCLHGLFLQDHPGALT